MEPVILFRNSPPSREFYDEMEVAKRYFRVETLLTKCQNCFVIPRFSCLPYYKEWHDNLLHLGSIPINHVSSHEWVASFGWYRCMRGLTPETWTEEEFPYTEYQGPFVVKGCTNSRKHQWDTHMFAPTKKDAIKIASELRNDMHLASQNIIYRKYVPLKTFEIGINGIPFANEWRIFCYRGHVLSHGYYWSGLDDLSKPQLNDDGIKLIHNCIERLRYPFPIDFYVLDIAETKSGEWILIEMNDAGMSGLSENCPDTFYSNLRAVNDWEHYCEQRYIEQREAKNYG